MSNVSKYLKLILFSACSTVMMVIYFQQLVDLSINSKLIPNKEDIGANSNIRETLISRTELNLSSLGKWLLSPEGSPPPKQNKSQLQTPYLILIWKHGSFLERRHIRRFTNKRFSPWEGCSVKNCVLSYKSEDLAKATAVVFHLHFTKSPTELPKKHDSNQLWIFLTDESPIHTFLYNKQKLSDYNFLFNWSMSYRMDSDIPVPYGRTRPYLSEISTIDYKPIKKKDKLVAVLISNCGGNNQRLDYIRQLKLLLNKDLDIFGGCLGGNNTACPGHFGQDCSILNEYKFYLAFENSNCRQYITEKVFWNGYQKYSVPVIMGAPKKDCQQLLPPNSFLHVEDFSDPDALAKYMKYLDSDYEKYIRYHEWRLNFQVLNEHGYFGSKSSHYCRICEALHYNSRQRKIYENLDDFSSRSRDCT